jgi:prepilin-type processing-associated H-X9-DG protein
MGEACFSTGQGEIIGNVARITGGTPPFTGLGFGNAPAFCLTVRDPNQPNRIRADIPFNQDFRGNAYAHGFASRGGINTILPPNSPSCAGAGAGGGGGAEANDDRTVVSSVASYHQGGAHVLMVDGAVRFVTDSIDAGNASAITVTDKHGNAGVQSPYGLWGALGTRASSETRTIGEL